MTGSALALLSTATGSIRWITKPRVRPAGTWRTLGVLSMWSRLLSCCLLGFFYPLQVLPFRVLEDPVWALLTMLSGSRLIKRGLHPTQEKQSAQAVLRFIRSIPGGRLF